MCDKHLCEHKLENRSDHDQLALKAHLLLLFAYPKTVRLSCQYSFVCLI